MFLMTTIFDTFLAHKLTAILTVLVALLTLVYLWFQHSYNYWQRKNLPFIPPTFLFGNVKDVILMRKCVCDTVNDFYQHPLAKDQPVIGIYIFKRPCLLIRDVELIKRVLIRDSGKFTNRFSSSDPHSDPLGSDNLFFVKNPKWKQIRVKLTPIFTSGKMRQMFPLVAEIGRKLDAYLCNLTTKAADKTLIGEVKDISALYSTDVIASVAYGIEANTMSDPNGIFRTAGKRIFNFTTRRALEVYCMFFLPQLVGTFGFKFFSNETTEFLRNLLNQVMTERTKSGTTRNDLIDLLINFRREAEADKEKKHFILEGDALIAQAAIFFSAGFETSSSTMSFSLYELAKNQDIQARLRAEICDTLKANNGELTYETLNEMKFLDNVVREVLRLYPVMTFLDRECYLSEGEDGYSLQPFCDFEIPHGMPIYIPLYPLHRDAKYFPEPNRFNPERFSPEQIGDNNMGAYLPFGMGPRNCIGERFGIAQTKIGLISFLRNHCVKPTADLPTELVYNPRALLLQPEGGINLRIIHDPLI